MTQTKTFFQQSILTCQYSYHYYAFGSFMGGRQYNSTSYRFGFNGKEKDDEVSGSGNKLDFGARIYDSRLGRWLSCDNVVKSFLSSYQSSRNNPLIFIDPDGNTEYFYLGKCIGTDNVENNLVAVVKTIDVKRQIKKGTYQYPKDIKNGTNNSDVFIIDLNVLKAAYAVLEASLTEKGKDREYWSGLNQNEKGEYVQAKEGIFEGSLKPITAKEDYSVQSQSSVQVNIHSHVTGSALDENNNPLSCNASDPSDIDKRNMEDHYEMSIIVGKDGLVGATRNIDSDGTASVTLDRDFRREVINVYDKDNKNEPLHQFTKTEASNIINEGNK